MTAAFLCNRILTLPYRFDGRAATKRPTRVSLSDAGKRYGNKAAALSTAISGYISALYKCLGRGYVVINHVESMIAVETMGSDAVKWATAG